MEDPISQTTESHLKDRKKETGNDLVFSYLTMRNLIGFFGMSLPFVLAIFPKRSSSDYLGFEPSISDYFYTDRGDILVVYLCIIGVFLFTYKGYTVAERALTFLAGFCGIAVAFVPTGSKCAPCNFSVHTGTGGLFSGIAGPNWHIAFAGTFLVSLAIMSLVYFPRFGNADNIYKDQDKTKGKSQKGKRNLMFKICGWIMITAVVVLVAYFIYRKFNLEIKTIPIIYVCETIAVEAFGLSWLTKGETLWPDGQHYMTKAIVELRSKMKKK